MFSIPARAIVLALLLFAASAAPAAEQSALSRTELSALRDSAPGDVVDVARVPLDVGLAGSARLRRIDVYAPGAKVLVAGRDGLVEVPRSDWLHFIADPRDPASPRLALSLSPDGRESAGVLMAPSGTFELVGARSGDGLALALGRRNNRAPGGQPLEFSCGSDEPEAVDPLGFAVTAGRAVSGPAVASPTLASRAAVIAIDTDNELLERRFANNTTAATNYIAALFAQLNIVYERDVDLTLQQGTTILRPSNGAPDPYPNTDTSVTVAQLVEFGTFWQNNYAATPRVLATMLSGRSGSSLSSSGRAWLLASGNWCAMRNGNGGAYNVTQVYWFGGATAASDVVVVAHELGHNLGVAHTHCTNAAGQFPATAGTLDQCYNGDNACYTGPQACPANPAERTVMSYCHLDCGGSTAVFHPVQVTTLNARIAQNQPDCIVDPATQNDAPTIAAPASIPVLENATSSLAGISFADADAGLGAVKASFSVGSGTINATSVADVTVGTALGGRSLTGTLSAVNDYIAEGRLTWTSPPGAQGNVVLGIGINDNGNTGTGGALSANMTVALAIQTVNDAPSLVVPTSLTVVEDVASAVTGISCADSDAGSGNVTATFQPSVGSVQASGSASVVVGGNATALTLTGTLAALNTAMSAGAVKYSTAPDSTAPATLVVTIDDNGNVGLGGPLSAQASIAIMPTPVNDAPRLGVPARFVTSVAGAAPLTGITISDPDSGGAPVVLTLSAIGTLYGSTAGGVTATGSATTTLQLVGTAGALATWLATTPPAYDGPGGTLTIVANDGGASGTGGVQSSTANVPLFADVLLRNGFE